MFDRQRFRPFLKPSTGIGRGHGKRKSSGKSGAGAIIDKSKYEAPTEYKATAPYRENVVEDPNGTLFAVGDASYTRYRRDIIPAENRKGYLAVRKAEEGSLVTVHYPEYDFVGGKVKAHDEYFLITRGASLSSEPNRKLQLEFQGSTLPNNEKISGRHPLWLDRPTREIANYLRHSDKITIQAPKIKAKPYREQLEEWRRDFNGRRNRSIAEVLARGAKIYGIN